MNIYFRLVKGKGVYDRVIRWYTRSDYTHAEFAWPLYLSEPEHWLGAQPKGGVSVRPSNYLGTVKYDLFCVTVPDRVYRKMWDYLSSQIGKPYDWKAIINIGVFNHDVSSIKRWFCSELVFAAFEHAGKSLLRLPLRERDRVTPRDLGLSTEIVRVE